MSDSLIRIKFVIIVVWGVNGEFGEKRLLCGYSRLINIAVH